MPTQQVQQDQQAPEPRGLEVFNAVKDRCVSLMGEEAFMREASYVLQLLEATPKLQECTRASLIAAMLNIANTGLTLNPLMKMAYLVPRNMKVSLPDGREVWQKRITVAPSYAGLMKVATDTGSVTHFESQVVYQGDQFEWDTATGKPKHHKPYWTLGNKRGEIIGAYGFAHLKGGQVVQENIGAEELALIRSKSDNANGTIYSDWAGEMARKAVIKRLSKYVPKSASDEPFLQAIEMDNEQFTLDGGEQEVKTKQLKAKVREALDFYQGDDVEELREECREAIKADRFTDEFCTQILARMGYTA